MRIAVIAAGSRGDVQPYVALGKGLRDSGNDVRLVTNLNYEHLVRSHDLDMLPVETDMQAVIENEKMREVLEKGNLLASMAQMSKALKRSAAEIAQRGLEASQGADMLLVGITGAFIGASLAEKTGLPLVQAYNVPLTPTGAFPGALLSSLASRLGTWCYRLSHHLTRQMIWQAYRPADRAVRRQVLGLSVNPFWGPYGSDVLRDGPVLYGFSPAVIAPPADWASAATHVTGYWYLEPPDDWSPSAALTQFLETEPAPVYIGFGSMSNRKPEETTQLVLRALERTGQRAIVFSGWGGLEKSELPESVLMVDSTPHTWLFPRVAAVVHHGGAGTTAAGLRGGVPSIIVPFHGDQPFWGQRVADLGVGPAPIPRSKLTTDRLVQALARAKGDHAMRRRAAILGARIREENGVANAVAIIQRGQRLQ